MLVDHANSYLLGGSQPWMYQAGRVVFPAFAIVLGLGIAQMRDDRLAALVLRLLVFALLAELCAAPLVAAGVREPALNVVYTLAAGVALVLGERAPGIWARGVSIALAVAISWPAEYGLIGAGLVWAVATRRGGFELALVAALCVWQATPMPFLVYALLEACGRAFAWEQVTAPRGLFAALYCLQFAGLSLAQR